MSLAVPVYGRYVQRAKIAKACGDIGTIGIEVERFRLTSNDRIPQSLDELGIEIPVDPWNRPYVYVNIQSAGAGFGGLRKDGKLNPLNTDFDLYSKGKNGDSKGPLSAKASRDDIIRANNGSFVGLGEDF
jgi:general secretion pathway protein G